MSIEENILVVKEKMKEAAIKGGRAPEDVLLLPVTKTHPIETLEEVIQLGYLEIGENKVQEIRPKYEHFGERAHMHMIGHLQQNKVKYIIDKVTLIHSIDSLRIAEKINSEAKKHDKVMDVLIQVNVAEDDAKYGFKIDEVMDAIETIRKLDNISIQGLMTIAPFVQDPEENRLVFRKLKDLFVDIQQKNIDNINMRILSMGMTNDYEVAIEEGSTLVRVGTGIFGTRNYR